MTEEVGSRQKVPRWVPISLLAVTTVALVVPGILLWRQRASGLVQPLAHVPPPRRSHSQVSTQANYEFQSLPNDPPRRRTGRLLVSQSTAAVIASTTSSGTQHDSFISPLYSLGAFGIATALVGLTAGVGVWGIKSSLDVENMEQFSTRMRALIAERMPVLASRMRRSMTFDPGSDGESTASVPVVGDQSNQWNSSAVEERLGNAYAKGGISAWGASVLRELEAEGKQESKKTSS
ncbi:hypothetical protein BD410DRAFT_898575 [Rickenella mellea]|uniref:Uncharacterized protein n=1 Tax=Rickenella mellea TaxID=50990 RepID=A0A4Y7Q5A7_9AGAM|nr:hypothetical protein BD410DRAFT_898575 [Rickenella mellea]